MTEKEREELLRELSFIKNRVEEIYSMLKKDGDFSVTMKEQQEKREKKITKLLRALGAPVSNKGYRYIKESLLLCLNIKVNTKITKKGKIKITNLDNFLLYRIVKVFHFI